MDRDNSIDIAKGIAIILVVVGHCHCIDHLTLQIIYSFHMPLFFIFAGWFFKERGIKESLKKDFRRLLVPYLVFACIATIKFFITHTILQGNWNSTIDNLMAIVWGCSTEHTSAIWGNMPSVGILWFLPTLFVCKNLYNAIYSRCSSLPKYRLPLLSIVIFAISACCMLIDRYIINMPLALLGGGAAMIFFHLGHIFNNKKLSLWVYVLLLICWFVSIKYSQLYMGNNHYGLYPIDIAGALGATLSLKVICEKWLVPMNFFAKYLTWLGINSMIIYCVHFIVIMMDPNTRMGIHDWYIWLVIDFAMILPLSYLCTKLYITKKIFMIK